MKALVSNFIDEYFDQNPLSLMAIISTSKGRAKLLSQFTNSPAEHKDLIQRNDEIGGDPTLQNSLEFCMTNSALAPDIGYSFKEVLVISSSLVSCDPDDISKTIDDLKAQQFNVSVISLSAQVYILEKLAKETNGTFNVAIDRSHFEILLQRILIPKPVTQA